MPSTVPAGRLYAGFTDGPIRNFWVSILASIAQCFTLPGRGNTRPTSARFVLPLLGVECRCRCRMSLSGVTNVGVRCVYSNVCGPRRLRAHWGPGNINSTY